MSTADDLSRIEADRQAILQAQQQGAGAKLKLYSKLSGPGWIASAITLGGGSLASSLYLGVLGGFSLLWVQPLAMIMGVIMLSAIGYVTLSTGERPFGAINTHVSPVLGWGWALAVAAANVVWCMPQYSLASGVLSQNLLPRWLSNDGALVGWALAKAGYVASEPRIALNTATEKLEGGITSDFDLGQFVQTWLAVNANDVLVSIVILVLCTFVTWSYDRGGRGLRIYETMLKIVVAAIVLCFLGVIVRLATTEGLDWSGIWAGFVPDFNQLFEPSGSYLPFLEAVGERSSAAYEFWQEKIVSQQRDVMISAAATAVGINMTFMFPYTMLRKSWTKEFRGLASFDLSTGMFIPYVLATSFVVIAAGARFHSQLPQGFTVETTADGHEALEVDSNSPKVGDFKSLIGERNAQLNYHGEDEKSAQASGPPPSFAEQRLAAMLVKRDAMDLSQSLQPLTGRLIANVVFGLGVLGMVLSTISILMLISGFVFAEMLGCPPGGRVHRAGTLVAGVGGSLWMLFWTGQSQFYLAVVCSVFGFMLLPFAYVTFVLLMNSRPLMGSETPHGFRRVWWNLTMGVTAIIVTAAAGYMVWLKTYVAGIVALLLYVGLALLVYFHQRNTAKYSSQERKP